MEDPKDTAEIMVLPLDEMVSHYRVLSRRKHILIF
jgi:hypothetical protein